MQDKNLGHFMPLIHVLWYLDKYVVDCGSMDAVVVVDETPAMAAKIAMSDMRTKVAFLAVSAIRQKDLSSAVGGALQHHAIIMRYMLDTDQMEDGVTGAHWDTQEHWLLRGIPLWVWDSDRGHQGHQKLHAAEAPQEQDVSEAPVDDSESTAPTLPKMKKTAPIVPSRGTAAGKGTPSSRKKKAKEKRKESEKAEESEDEEADEEVEEDDGDQVMETQKRKPTPAYPFDASPHDAPKDQPKEKAKTAGAEFKPSSRSGSQPSLGTVGSPGGGSSVARSPSAKLAKAAAPKKK